MAVTGTNIDEKTTATAAKAAMEFPVRQSDGTQNSMPMTMVALEYETTYNTSANHADITGVVGQIHVVDLSGLTSEVLWTTPASASVGDRCGVYIKETNSTAGRELGIRTPATDEIAGTNYASADATRLWQEGEFWILECISATNPDWRLAHDGRIACNAKMTDDSGTTDHYENAIATVPDFSNGTVNYDIGGLASKANESMTIRRTGKYSVRAFCLSPASQTDQDAVILMIRLNPDGSATNLGTGRDYLSFGSSNRVEARTEVERVFSAGDEIDITVYQAKGTDQTWETTEAVAPYLAVIEKL